MTFVRDTFGGYSLEGPFQGAWVDDEGRAYEETSYRLEVLVPADRLAEARERARRQRQLLADGTDPIEARKNQEMAVALASYNG